MKYSSIKAIREGAELKCCSIICKDLNKLETVLFTECKNSIPFDSYCYFNFGILVGFLINLETKI